MIYPAIVTWPLEAACQYLIMPLVIRQDVQVERQHGQRGVSLTPCSYDTAIRYLKKATSATKSMQGVGSIWSVSHCNLGHAYRVQG